MKDLFAICKSVLEMLTTQYKVMAVAYVIIGIAMMLALHYVLHVGWLVTFSTTWVLGFVASVSAMRFVPMYKGDL